MSVPVKKFSTHVPALEEVSSVLQTGLEKNFKNVQVNVVDCPDLTQAPFHLAAKGLCGSARLADVGGPPYLVPLPQKNKSFELGNIAKLVELPGAFMVGAGAGPWNLVGVNSEMICNLHLALDNNSPQCCNTHVAKVDTQNGSCVLLKLGSTNFNLMANLFCSEGKPGKVLEIKASQRSGKENFMSMCRKVLKAHYKEKPVALGGVFLVEKGKARLHIMPDFSCTPLKTDEDVDNWLTFHEMNAILICLGELVSHDPGYDLRMEHFHCFSTHGEGGHYHNDTTPKEVEYRAYFNIAESIYRIDAPEVTHTVGRDMSD